MASAPATLDYSNHTVVNFQWVPGYLFKINMGTRAAVYHISDTPRHIYTTYMYICCKYMSYMFAVYVQCMSIYVNCVSYMSTCMFTYMTTMDNISTYVPSMWSRM